MGALMIFSCIVYIVSATWLYSIIKDVDFLSRSLGGQGDVNKTFIDFPFQN